MDNEVKVAIRANATALQSGLAEAQANVRQAAASMKEAMDAFGKSAAEGNAQAAEILKQYRAELASAQSNLEALKGARDRDTESLRSNVSAYMAMNAELRVAQGNVYGVDRAVASLATKLPGLGAAAQAAFIPFAAIGVVEMLEQIQSSIKGVIDAYNQMSIAAVHASTEAILAGEKLIQVKPEESWTQFLARNLAGADRPLPIEVQNASARLQQIEYARQLADAQAAVNEQGKMGVALQRQRIADAKQEIDFALQAKAAAEDLIATYTRQLYATHEVTRVVPGSPEFGLGPQTVTQTVRNIVDPKEVEAIQSQLGEARKAVDRFQHEIDLAKVHLEGAKLKLPEVDTKAFKKSQRELQAMSRETDHLIDEETRRELESYKKLDELSHRFKRDNIPLDHSDNGIDKAVDDYIALGKAQLGASKDQDELTARINEAMIHAKEATGAITPLAAAHAMAAEHTRQFAHELDQLNADLAVELKLGKDVEAQQTRDAIAKAKGEQQVVNIQDQTRIAQLSAQPWLQAANQIADAYTSAFSKIVIGGNDARFAMLHASEQMTSALLGDAERWVIKKLELYAMDVIHHAVAEHQKQASTAAANAASQTQTAAANVSEALSYAAVAAAGAAAAVAAIPIVGPTLAPAAASATYAETSAWASLAAFEKGTSFVPRDGVAMLHKGEAVIDAGRNERLTSALERIAYGSGSQTGQARGTLRDLHLHYSGGRSSGPGDLMNEAGRLLRHLNLTT